MQHYGILSNVHKNRVLAALRADLAPNRPAAPKRTRKELRAAALVKLLDGRPTNWCACCRTATMVRIGVVPPQARAPPGAMPIWHSLQP